MLRRICFLIIAAVVVYLWLAEYGPGGARARYRQGAELHLLDSIGIGVQLHLEQGGQLPTNWMTLTNAMNWDKVAGISEYNHLPLATETYTVLTQPVTNPATGGFCFLLSSQPTAWPARDKGRWILVVAPKLRGVDWSSNKVYRTWWPETALPPEIRSQLVTLQKP